MLSSTIFSKLLAWFSWNLEYPLLKHCSYVNNNAEKFKKLKLCNNEGFHWDGYNLFNTYVPISLMVAFLLITSLTDTKQR